MFFKNNMINSLLLLVIFEKTDKSKEILASSDVNSIRFFLIIFDKF